MEYINSTNLRNHLDRFLQKVQSGDSFIVTLFGKPVAYVGPLQEGAPKIPPKKSLPAKGAFGLLSNLSSKEIEQFERHSQRRPFFDS